MVLFYTCHPFETAPSFVRCSKGCCLVSHGNKNMKSSGAILALLLHLLTLKMKSLCPAETARTVYPTTHRCLSEDWSLQFFALCLFEEIFVTTFNIKNEMCNYVHVRIFIFRESCGGQVPVLLTKRGFLKS